MFARIASLLVVVVVTSPALADPPKKADPAADILAKFREPWNDQKAGNGQVQDLIDVLTKLHGVPVVVKADEFKQAGMDGIYEKYVRFPSGKGLGLRSVMNTVLAQVNGTFLVRKDHVEFLPIPLAARVTGSKVDDDGGISRLTHPLVSVVVKEKPLNEVAAEIAEEFDLNVVVSMQAGDSRMGFVSLRLLNVPADKALDTLATAADLRVVRKGNVFFITSRDHANELFGEKLDKERQKIELEKLRDAPANPFGPLVGQPPVAPPPVPKAEEKK
jgi:hypothetical protein